MQCRSLRATLFAAACFLPAAMAQHPMVEIKVTGNQRVPASAVVAASGLQIGHTVGRTELDAAVQKLMDTGFLSRVNYRFDPKPGGFTVTLSVAEEPNPTPVVLDIPGQDAEQLWKQLKSADGLIDRQIPGNDRASAYFTKVIQSVLQKANHPQEIVIKSEADLVTRQTVFLCRPAHLPKVTAMRFEGNAAINAPALETALSKVAMGEDYTERDYRRKLELNIRPLYEELGRLTVTFPQVKMDTAGNDAVAVTAVIDEGPVWRLGKVELIGEALPVDALREAAQFTIGAPANWKRFVLSLGDMEKVLRRNGYITVTSKPARAFRDAGQIVDVNVEVTKGRQFLFGDLHLEGLDEATQKRLAAAWKLAAGAPMDEFYINEYFRAVFPSLQGKYKPPRSQMHVRPDSNVVDVTITFHS